MRETDYVAICFVALTAACGGEGAPAALGSAGPTAAAREIAASEPDACAALDAALPTNVAALAEAEHRAYRNTLRERCIAATCAAFGDAVRSSNQAGVDGAVVALARLATPEGAATPNPMTVPASCQSALVLDQVRGAYRRAEGAAAAHPPRWSEALAAIATAPAVPLDVAVFVGDSSIVDRVRAGAYAHAADDAARAVAAADWPGAVRAAAEARGYANLITGPQRPTAADLGRLDGFTHRAEACEELADARTVELAEEVGQHVTVALAAIDAIPVGEPRPSSSERSRLTSTVSAANREFARCERQIELNEYCLGRCDTMGEYRPESWMERCEAFCDSRAPLCFDQRDRWVAAGRPRSGVAVPELAMCRPGAVRVSAAAPTGGSASTGGSSGGTRRRRVSADDFE